MRRIIASLNLISLDCGCLQCVCYFFSSCCVCDASCRRFAYLFIVRIRPYNVLWLITKKILIFFGFIQIHHRTVKTNISGIVLLLYPLLNIFYITFRQKKDSHLISTNVIPLRFDLIWIEAHAKRDCWRWRAKSQVFFIHSQ